jgi:hypothetical protein
MRKIAFIVLFFAAVSVHAQVPLIEYIELECFQVIEKQQARHGKETAGIIFAAIVVKLNHLDINIADPIKETTKPAIRKMIEDMNPLVQDYVRDYGVILALDRIPPTLGVSSVAFMITYTLYMDNSISGKRRY